MVLIDGLVSYYKLDTNSATQIDSVGSYNGTVDGATFTSTGKVGGAYIFDGDDKISFAPTVLYNVNAFSIALWVKLTNEDIDYNVFSAGAAYTRIQFSSVASEMGIASNGNYLYSTTTGVDWTDWHQIVFVTDGTNKFIYIDGELNDSEADTANFAPSGGMVLGTNNVNTSERLVGAVDEFGLWNRAITSDEVALLYNNGAGLAYPFVNIKINIGDSWKQVAAVKLNIGDSWKAVDAVKINIGDAWKAS